MGCVSSKPDINDQHPNIFQVSNVNEQGNSVSPGQLEVTETELVLYQRGKPPTIWPLRSLRKYGYDSEIFSFECGRRSPTGEGIYAFRCKKAEQLFNIVQHHIIRNSNDEPNPDFPVPVASTGPPVVQRREPYLNPAGNANNSNSIRTHPGLSRPNSVTSNGTVSPTAISPPPVSLTGEVSLEHNNNKRGSLIADHSYTNSGVITETNYENFGVVNSPTGTSGVSADNSAPPESPYHVYINVDTNTTATTNTKELTLLNNVDAEEDFDLRHCYANIDTKELEHLRPFLKNENPLLPSVPQTPVSLYVGVHEVNYAELDLDQSKHDVPTTSQVTPDSPKTKKSYATIDFQKTTALSQSTNPRNEIEEGSRKTRHNSTISEVTARHSNSLSD